MRRPRLLSTCSRGGRIDSPSRSSSTSEPTSAGCCANRRPDRPKACLRAAHAGGLTQRQLAERAHTAQSVVARIETGATDTLGRLLEVADFALHAVAFDVFGVRLEAASLDDIMRSKEAAGRPQDRQDVEIIREMLRRRG